MEPEQDEFAELTAHEEAQLNHVLANTTPGDRIRMVEQMRLMFGTDYLLKARELKWRMERNEDGSEKRKVNWGKAE